MKWAGNDKGTTTQRKAASRILLAAFLCVVVSLSLNGQQRPLLTEDPRLISNGAFVMESGFGYARKAQFPLSGLKGDEYSAFVNGLNFSLGSRAEFQINGVIQNFVKVGNNWRNDVGDWSFSTKIRLVPETPELP